MRRSHRCFGFLAILFAAGGLAAQDPKPEIVRTVYQPKHLNAKTLADALTKQFNGVAEITSLTDSGTNAVLLSAPKPIADQVASILDKLDRKPRLVEVQVAVLEVRVKPEDAKGKLTEADLKDLSGPSAQVFDKLAALQKEGKISALRKTDLIAAENQKSRQQNGATKAMVTDGPQLGGFGNRPPQIMQSVRYSPTGLTVTANPQFSDDGTVTLELSVEDLQLVTPEDGVNANGSIVQEPTSTQLQTRLNLTPGTAILVQGMKSESKSMIVKTYVVIGAKPKEETTKEESKQKR